MSANKNDGKLFSFIPLPMCIVNGNGKILESNARIGDVFLYDDIKDNDFFVLTGIRFEDLKIIAESNAYQILERNGKIFRIYAEFQPDTSYTYVYFEDVTHYEDLKTKYNDERVCVARINIDNVDELEASTVPTDRLAVSTEADKIIRDWAEKIHGSIVMSRGYEYVVYFEHKYLSQLIEDKFSILDKIREIHTETDFPMSLSIGIGSDGSNLMETRHFSDSALDLALGRGGDQAVVKQGNRIDYFGGKSQSVEKGNKGKSRVVAHALIRLIEQANKVMIMAHRNADMDAFGSALGICRVCHMNGKNASIVISEVNDSLQAIYKEAKRSGIYTFIDRDQAIEQINNETLLIVLDTHRPSYVDCSDLLGMTSRIVVIDHHRRSADAIRFPLLSYIESYASSTAELVTEILQYTNAKKLLRKLEAQALLAGMMVDTNRFSVKTGVRTFEAAAWLRRAGADVTEVKKFFQENLDSFKIRAKAIAQADIRDDGIAMSICEGFNEEAQVINARVADELLNIRGMRASFVAGMDETGKTMVSARSLGDLNVQVIMEKLGGGGHLTTAGSQVEESPEEILEIIEQLLLSEGVLSEASEQ